MAVILSYPLVSHSWIPRKYWKKTLQKAKLEFTACRTRETVYINMNKTVDRKLTPKGKKTYVERLSFSLKQQKKKILPKTLI